MPITIGTNLGPYEILAPLGAGGMGEVYRARDTRLDRDVAIKVLPASMTCDRERIARFEREAKVLASLNHPGIAAIYGFEEHRSETGAAHFIVMEYVEGETLAQRLKSGALGVEDALNVAKQMAEALEAAHEKGVIHRDLKPANVMIRADGMVKVLDFGLAKAVADDPSAPTPADSPTITANYTKPGVVLGTAAYMSPEQARGRPLDKRTDIWSFGVVLFECLSGKRPFEGDTASDLVARILEREADWTALPPATPPLIQLLLRRCLTKDHKRRLRDIGDARVDIESALDDPTTSGLLLAHGALANASERRSRRTGRLFVWLAIGVLIGAGVSSLVRFLEPIAPIPVVRFAVDVPPDYSLIKGDSGGALSLNATGTLLAFVADRQGKRQIFLQDLSVGEPRLLPGTEFGSGPFFSPDSRWVGFVAHSKLMKVPVSGGPPLVICEARGSHGTWLNDGTIVLSSTRDSLVRVDAQGGIPHPLATAGPTTRTEDDTQLILGFCTFHAVPGADYLLAGVWDGSTIHDYDTVAVSLADGTVRPVLQRAVDARYVPPGFLVFMRGSSLLAAPFDVERGVVTGEAFQVIDGVLCNRWADGGQFAVSTSGTLAYIPGGRPGPGRRLIRVTHSGKSAPLMERTDALAGGLRVSPDGRNISIMTLRHQVELWTFNLERRALSLVINVGESWSPVWTHDSTGLVFQQIIPEQPPRMVHARTDAGSPTETVPIEQPGDTWPGSFSPDGRLLLVTVRQGTSDGWNDIALHHWGQDDPIDMLLSTPANEAEPMFAPDGAHFAYVSNETGRYEVFIRTLLGEGPKWQVSREGGYSPRWSRDGTSLFFLDFKEVLYSVAIDTQADRQASPPVRLFDTTEVATTDVWGNYDVLADGDFVMVEPAEWEKEPARIHVVTNWASELGKASTR